MTETLLSPLEVAEERAGLVGERQLVCVQTFYLSRLTAHPVVLVPGTFVAVTGRGPKGDSNGSGKTSFLAAVSLLLGDPEWRLAGGAKAPTALLFDVQATGGLLAGAERYESAGHGYAIGVFADPGAPAPEAITVWCRIDTTAPYLTVRWATGVHLVNEIDDRGAHDAADARWAALRGDEAGFNSYAARLYGETPRCLAYVQQRGDKRNPPSLLQMHAGEFTPEQIGDSLIRLTGHRHLLDEELGHRKRLAEEEDRLVEREREDLEASRAEEVQLEDVRNREAARDAWARAGHHWRLHFARGYLDVFAAEAELDEALADARAEAEAAGALVAAAAKELDELDDHEARRAEAAAAADVRARAQERLTAAVDERRALHARISQLTEHRNDLRSRALGWSGLTVDEAEEQFADAARQRDAAIQAVGAHEDRARAALDTVAALESGGSGLAGTVLATLRTAGVSASGLLDGVVVEDEARSFWEPVLSAWTDAVVVASADVSSSLEAVADVPGAVVIEAATGGDASPAGIVSAPAGAGRFLAGLSSRYREAAEPDRAVDDGLGVHVVGGYRDPNLGRAARVAVARRALATAEEALGAATARVATADRVVVVARDEVDQAWAAVELDAVTTELEALPAQIVTATSVEDERARANDAAERAHIAAEVALQHHETLTRAAMERFDRVREQQAATEQRVASIEADRARLALDYWRTGWGGTAVEARAALGDDSRGEPRLRKEASEALRVALSDLGIKDESSPAPTPELLTVVRRRWGIDEDGERGIPRASLDDVGAPLADYLDSWHDQDDLIAATIAADRDQRAQQLDAARRARDEVQSGLAQLQDAVETIVEASLHAISEQLDRMRRAEGGHGAGLVVDAIRPDGPNGLWQWRVTPRWRRVPGGPLLRYDTRSNTAQEKLFTVQLVLAALLSAPNPRGRVLVLDELGDSLGDEHRKAVLRAIGATAAQTGITVLGTCQDSVLADAARECGAILFFEHTTDTDVLNRPTRVFGHDDDGARIELTRDATSWGRPPV